MFYIYIILMYFPSQNPNMIGYPFLEKSIIKKLFNFKVYLSLFNTEETKTLIGTIAYLREVS